MESSAIIKKKIQKRNRVPLACSNCRKKKTKCDRNKPICQVCQAHGLTNCEYFQENIDLGAANIGTFTAVTKEKEKEKKREKEEGKEKKEKDVKKPDHTTEYKELREKIERLENILAEQHSMRNLYQPLTITDKSKVDNYSINFNGSGDYLISMRQLFATLKINGFDQIQIYQDLDSKLSQYSFMGIFGPFAWSTLIIKDPFTTPLWKRVIAEQCSITWSTIASKDSPVWRQPTGKQNKIKSNFKKIPLKSHLVNLDKEGTVLNTVDILPVRSEHKTLTEKIKMILPSKKGIWLFIKRFFKYAYPFVPYLDELDFIAVIERIIVGNHHTDLLKNEKVTVLHIQQNTDLAVIGSLLTVIMFAYESLVDNTGKLMVNYETTEDEKYLMKYEYSDMLIGAAELCMNEYKLLKRCQLPVLQCAILLREYQKVDGCDCFADGDSHIYTGLLIQMATTLGLNRDPAFIENVTAYSKKSLLLRKIWYGLISADNYQYTQTGTPPSINAAYYDTKLPWYDENVTNIEDKELERVTIEMIREKFMIESKMRKIADLAANMLKRPTIEELLISVFELKICVNEKFVSLNNILMTDHENNINKKVKKVLSLMIYMHSLTFLQPVMLHIFYHYQKLRNFDATFFFYNKILSFWMFIVGNLYDLINSSDKFFGSGFDLFVVPLIEVAMHKGLTFFTSSYIKVLIVQKKLDSIPGDHTEILNVIKYYKKNVLQKLFYELYLPILNRLSKKYFYCWRMLKAHTCIFKNLSEEKIDYSAQFPVFNFMECFTADNFRFLIQTSSWKYYKAGIDTEPWLTDWLNKYHQYVYCIPSHEILSADQTTSSIDSLQHTPVYPTNDISHIDEMWLNKIYEKVFANKNNYTDTIGDNSVMSANPNELFSINKEMMEIDSLMQDNTFPGVHSMDLNFNDYFWMS
ncbi:hap1 transcriptional regulatory prottein [Pichia californica]|uniref:Hap1 transcriptional regulatory prottein n=1 Tax=Pichia californica TaxID=460514 RepID=A0A9P6WRB5_9ASCO|nr:hap1 transcriptional regulatory prottein [[Candida] californica]KAG0690758.1 hap1 transcriptional regulatory prottein [[Candida] californica]